MRPIKISLITAVFGRFDEIPPQPLGFDEYILLSDEPIESDWKNIVVGGAGDSRLASKVPKFRPDLFVSNNSSVWMDASLRDPNSWLYEASESVLTKHQISFFRHPDRSNVSDEVELSLTLFKYHRMPLAEQLNHYRALGFNDESGLWACGVIARNHTEEVRKLGDRWLQENVLWSTQDQISLPFLLQEMNLTPGEFPADLWKGPLNWVVHKFNDYEHPKGQNLISRNFKGVLARFIRKIFFPAA